jgi:hypothetical protein
MGFFKPPQNPENVAPCVINNVYTASFGGRNFRPFFADREDVKAALRVALGRHNNLTGPNLTVTALTFNAHLFGHGAEFFRERRAPGNRLLFS